ncbi:hypothetical protein FIM10_07520 [Sphingomonadales bacterium 56]|uniref:hypothetical protein n=1 Tax=unclassified Sphingobium TaxID=2611147 RepID=UPI001919B244|nr:MULTISPECIES: hypothetical protein [unclassified Sphingobium]MBY2928522.1 hypothetical protein [Sphingomonadales bacterium 56]MBY2959630.1 hypothetical protein [Sphingomonadales bacterium 58]
MGASAASFRHAVEGKQTGRTRPFFAVRIDIAAAQLRTVFFIDIRKAMASFAYSSSASLHRVYALITRKRMTQLVRALCFSILLAFSSWVGAVTGPSGLAEDERTRITLLMQRAVQTARIEADEARSNQALSADDRRDAQSQFALILMTLSRCDETLAFVQERTEIKATGIERLISRAAENGVNRSCIVRLAALMGDRTDDPYLTPGGRLGKRYLAAAYLDAAGDKEAHTAMTTAETAMLSLPNHDTVWDARWSALAAYNPTPRAMEYIEYLAVRMASENYSAASVTGRSLLALLAAKGRCDLVERIVKNGPKSCDEPRRLAEGIYINRREPDNLAYMVKMLGADTPSPTDQSLTDAMTARDPWGRITKLLQLIRSCKNALSASEASTL